MASAASLRAQRWPAGTVPVVSVLVRAYNHERFLDQCLQGILNQVTDFPVEIIVNDDASTDRTAAIVREFAAECTDIVRPVLQDVNQHSRQIKCLPALNALARGAFIAYCDGDDVWLDQEKLQKQVGFLRANPSWVLSFHDAIDVDQENRVIRGSHLSERARSDYAQAELREMKWGWMLLGSIVHRHLQMDFPPEFHLAPNGDNFLPMLLASGGGAKFQGEVGPLAYRQHPGGMWSSRTKADRARMHLQTYLQIAAYFVRIGETGTARNIIAGRLSGCAQDYFQVTSGNP